MNLQEGTEKKKSEFCFCNRTGKLTSALEFQKYPRTLFHVLILKLQLAKLRNQPARTKNATSIQVK